MQVEDQLCLTGGEDGDVRLWDLRKIDPEDDEGELVELSEIIEESEEEPSSPATAARTAEAGHRMRSPPPSLNDPCTRTLQGHTKSVTALYFEDECLVTGASDKTLRQWDLRTGQCVMTMDILWAMSHSAGAGGGYNAWGASQEDFVGGLQFWGYGLVSGSADGAVRMWDSTSHLPPFFSFCACSTSIFSADGPEPSYSSRTYSTHQLPAIRRNACSDR